MDVTSLVVRVSIMYVYALVVIRLAGKRSLGNLSPFDFVMATMVGDFFDDIFWAQVPLPQGLTAITTVIALHILGEYLALRHPRLRRWLEGRKTPIIHEGQFLLAGLHQERTSRENVLSELRLRKLTEKDLAQIREACWEPNGGLSILPFTEARPAQKRDGFG